MPLIVISFSHQTAPFDLLGRVALSEPLVPVLLKRLAANAEIAEVACLSTCNRTEVYCTTDEPAAARRLVVQALAEMTNASLAELAEYANVMEDLEAWRHLFGTTSGIYSLIVGELEILGQVRRSWETAELAGTGGAVLGGLFRRAIQVGRRARQETNISRGNLSVASAAVGLIRERLPDLSSCRALVIGTGQVGQKVMELLTECGVSAMMLVNRTAQKAESLAEKMGCTPIPMEKMVEAISQAEIIVCATGAPHYVVWAEMLRQTGGTTNGGKVPCRILMDLSAPPNIEPAVAQVPGNVLFTIADLQEIASRNSAVRQQEVKNVVSLIDREMARMAREGEGKVREEIIREFRITMESIRTHHLKNAAKRFDDEARAELDRYSRSLVSALLHGIVNNVSHLPTDTPEAERELEIARKLLLRCSEEKSVVLE